ncbi:hypothetical protein ACLOJK_012992 [Asimina triloba]
MESKVLTSADHATSDGGSHQDSEKILQLRPMPIELPIAASEYVGPPPAPQSNPSLPDPNSIYSQFPISVIQGRTVQVPMVHLKSTCLASTHWIRMRTTATKGGPLDRQSRSSEGHTKKMERVLELHSRFGRAPCAPYVEIDKARCSRVEIRKLLIWQEGDRDSDGAIWIERHVTCQIAFGVLRREKETQRRKRVERGGGEVETEHIPFPGVFSAALHCHLDLTPTPCTYHRHTHSSICPSITQLKTTAPPPSLPPVG